MGKINLEGKKKTSHKTLPLDWVFNNKESLIKTLNEHLLERRYWAAVLGNDNMKCGNVELHMSKASENGDLLIGEDKRLLIYKTELIPVYKLSKKKKRQQMYTKLHAEAKIINALKNYLH